MKRINKSTINRDIQINLARKHIIAYHAARELLNAIVNSISSDLQIISFDEDIERGLHSLHDNTHHMPVDIDGAIHDSEVPNLYTEDEQSIIDDAEKETPYKSSVL